MKLTILVFIICVSGCVNQAHTPKTKTWLDGKTYTIKGGGYASKDGVFLYKTGEINNLIGGCPPLLFGLTHARCLPRYLTNHQVTVRPVMKGQHPYEAIGNSPTGIYKYEMTTELIVPLRQTNTQADCFIVVAQNGALLPIREGKGADRYTFSNPLYKHRERTMAATELQGKSKNSINFHQLQINTADRTLRNSPAFSKGRCILPKRKALPPQPRNVMSQKEALFNANGFCFTLLAVRHSVGVVNNAIDSMGEFGMFKVAQKWRQNPAPSCAKSIHSQIEDTLCRPGGSVGSMFRDWNRSCLQNLFKQCRNRVISQCGGEMNAWRVEVRRIKNAPRVQKQYCEQAIKKFKDNDKRIQDIKQEIKAYERQKTAPPPITGELIDLKTARCS